MANAPDAALWSDDDLDTLFLRLRSSRGLVLAVSGGSDSTALMLLFAQWARRHSHFAQSLVLTVDHGLRPEAAAEADLVKSQAIALGLRHQTLVWHGAKPTSDIQSAARAARYRLMVEATRVDGADAIITAHTHDDQAETFLMALARGSGVYGLSAMPPERMLDGIRLVRPLLGVAKARLTAMLQSAGMVWSEDPSNGNPRFRRITLRKAMPGLQAIGLTATVLADTAARLARAASALETYADRLIAEAVTVHVGGFIEIDVMRLMAEPEEIGLRVMARAVKALKGADYVPRLDRLERFLRDMREAATSGTRLQRTLAGVVAYLAAQDRDGDRMRLWLVAEAGRQGFESLELLPGETRIWDNRVQLTLGQEASHKVAIRALGASARRLLEGARPAGVPTIALSSLAGAWRGETLIAVAGVTGVDSGLIAIDLIADRLRHGGFADAAIVQAADGRNI